MGNQAYERVLKTWAKDWIAEHFDIETSRLSVLAHYDLMFSAPCDGSVNDPPTDEYGNENEWSGYDFTRACAKIKAALENLPSVLYIDVETEHWSETAPSETDECVSCDGKGENTDEDGEVWKCGDCEGNGRVEAFLECWYKVEHSDLVKAIVGKELAQYV